ncbi:hypothetical protein N0V84_003295 [Fusarium piperis]|uniref:F-box domain-containing protein n=1 Tax=Fusarium piperis TaxID=1435070 RepID=A0A9W8WHP4_9HYPO|nr:hypothetical protein N0V84_003295 [Fusarium piperis]
MKPPAMDYDSDGEVLIDNTEALILRSKKTNRQKKKLERKTMKEAAKPHLLALYPELMLEILSHLRPSDIISYQQTCQSAKAFVEQHETSITKHIISFRYSVLEKCFPKPVFLDAVDRKYHCIMLNQRRQRLLTIHRKPYAHIADHDGTILCSCLTCVLAWNNLCLIVDLSHWTTSAIAHRKPIPMIPRGQNPEWNLELVEKHAEVVRRALKFPLWYALLLQRHLQTTVFGIRRYTSKDGEAGFGLDDADVAAETDAFCARDGPPSYEFPLHRDTYYSLQTYLPNRTWKKEEGGWRYQPADQHIKDLEWMMTMPYVWMEPASESDTDEEDVKTEQPVGQEVTNVE